MGQTSVERIGYKLLAKDDRADLPPLHKVIKGLKDRCYAVSRYAYLKEYDYFIVETSDFKMGVYKKRDPGFYNYLERHKLKDELFWICVEGLEYFPIAGAGKAHWGSSDSDKAAQYWLEGDALDRPLPDNDDYVDTVAF